MNLIDYGFSRTCVKEITPADIDIVRSNKSKTNHYTNYNMYIQDQKFGKGNEDKFKMIVEQIVGKKVQKYTERYATFDYHIKGEMDIEMKSRRNDILKYPTQMIGCNKINSGRAKMNRFPHYKVLYIYVLTDGIYYWYDDGRPLKFIMKGNYARGQTPQQLYLIPNELLTRFEPPSP